MRGLEKNRMGRGQTHKHADIATTRKNRPKGRFFENETNGLLPNRTTGDRKSFKHSSMDKWPITTRIAIISTIDLHKHMKQYHKNKRRNNDIKTSFFGGGSVLYCDFDNFMSSCLGHGLQQHVDVGTKK